MNQETTRRAFLHGSALATGGLLVTESAAASQEHDSHHRQKVVIPQSTRDYPRDRPSPTGRLAARPTAACSCRGSAPRASRPPVIVPDLAREARLEDGRRRQGVPPLLPPHPARVSARPVHRRLGLQRLDARPDHRGRPGRPGADLGPQRAPRIDGHPLARPGSAHRHGRRARASPSRRSRPARRRRSSSPSTRTARSSTTRTTECRTEWGWSGLFIIHPKVAHEPRVDRDFALLDPGVGDPAGEHDPEHDVDGVQPVHDQRPRRPVRHAPGLQAGRAGADPPGQLRRDRSPPDAPARPDVLRHRHRGGADPARRPGFRGTPCWSRWRRCARSSSSPTTRATGCCTATCSTT